MNTPLRYRGHHTPRAHHAAIPPAVAPPLVEPPRPHMPSPHSAHTSPMHTPPMGASPKHPLPKHASPAHASPAHASPARASPNHALPTHTPPVAARYAGRTGAPLASPSPPVTPPTAGSPRPLHARQNRDFNRAQRAQGKIVDPSDLTRERTPATGPDALADLLAASARAPYHHVRNNLSISTDIGDKTSVSVRLPSRKVTKHVAPDLTATDLAHALVREHRLEFNFEDNTVGEDDEIILWECVDGTRRPLRASENVRAVVQRWDARARAYLRTTSTSLRNDVDSLASLVPRRDMLRAAPELDAAAVHFSRPSVMYDPHQNENGAPYGQSPRPAPARGDSSDKLQRVPSKLCPNDHTMAVRRNRTDNDDVPLHSRLVWGFGALTLRQGRIEVKQKPGDELVCSLDISNTDVYEWPHNGPKKYVVVLRAQNRNSRAVYVCTDSARVFSVLRNAVFTARTKALMRS